MLDFDFVRPKLVFGCSGWKSRFTILLTKTLSSTENIDQREPTVLVDTYQAETQRVKMMNTIAPTHESIGDMNYFNYRSLQHQNSLYEPEAIPSNPFMVETTKLTGKIDASLFEDTFNEPLPAFPSSSYQLTDYDVLVGRHKLAFNHVGNRRFRVIVSMFLPRYFEHTSRRERSVLNLEIVETIQRAGGRFFKEIKPGQLVEISEKEKRNKVGHALRDAAAAVTANQNPKKKAKKVMKQETVPKALEKFVTISDSSNDSTDDDELDFDDLFMF